MLNGVLGGRNKEEREMGKIPEMETSLKLGRRRRPLWIHVVSYGKCGFLKKWFFSKMYERQWYGGTGRYICELFDAGGLQGAPVRNTKAITS